MGFDNAATPPNRKVITLLRSTQIGAPGLDSGSVNCDPAKSSLSILRYNPLGKRAQGDERNRTALLSLHNYLAPPR